jgi:cytochrome c biogenesis protein CcmG/thiol:disulfide interchange protein DsbE
MKPRLIPLLLFLVIAAVLAVGLTLNPREVPSPLIGKPAPEFTAPMLYEPERTISRADILGEVVAVNVFASWCVACREEHPYIMALAQHYGVPVYGLNYKDTRQAATEWLAKMGNAYAGIIYDPEGKIGLDWGVYGVPETFILDRQGVIRYKRIGAIDARLLEQEILPLVRQLRAEAP